ncbi:hypothetical protein PgNI_11149 [Pyricularia grisea]|uniref:Aldehyde dehydrogenase domain-containing protein n=1 Tax=Pyricularia grisea TaxID=148305 RepID=A0A6P8APU0_PYRGI|nr:hypothetical protein PgNI_11149 [Pyricularia grisea]TLD04069.1 hypothetical protein PgNI_11149 [Pyricularia grisea]
MLKHVDDLATIIPLENCNPLADSRTEVAYAASYLERFSEEAPRVYGDTIQASNPGCRVVTLKEPIGAPAEAPLTSLVLAELAHKAGFPAGVINVITALENTVAVGKLLTTDKRVKKVSFNRIDGCREAAVFEDADLDAALKGLIACKFRLLGQTCYELGDGFAASKTHGPLIHGRAVEKVEEHVQDAQNLGARVLFGGKPSVDFGPNFFGITVLADVTPDTLIWSLAGYFFSRDVNRCWRVAEALKVGMVGVNTGAISDPAAPFGGVKESGFGREGSKYEIQEFLTAKMVMTAVN